MKPLLALVKKEITSLFGSPLAYISMALFHLILVLLLWFIPSPYNLRDIGLSSMRPVFRLVPWLLIVITAILSMRSFAQEQQQGTLSWLFSQPLSLAQLVLGKMAGIWALLSLCFLLLLPHLIALQYFSTMPLDYLAILAAFIGIKLLSLVFTSVAVFCSSLSGNPSLSAIYSLALNGLLYFIFSGLASFSLLGRLDYWVQQLSLQHHYIRSLKGILDGTYVFYALLLTFSFFYLTLQQLKQKKINPRTK